MDAMEVLVELFVNAVAVGDDGGGWWWWWWWWVSSAVNERGGGPGYGRWLSSMRCF